MGRAVIAPLHCALVEVTDQIRLLPQSKLAHAYGEDAVHEATTAATVLTRNSVPR